MIFHFGHMFMDQGAGGRFDPIPWAMSDFKRVFKTWDDTFEKSGWGSVFLGNHDFPRMVSRWGNDKQYWEKSSKLLITLLLSMRGTPFVFQGDEIGMTNATLNAIDESKDIETATGWREAKNRGVSESDFLKVANYAGRDNARTPMQWNAGVEGGFTNGKPWMNVNPNVSSINVETQQRDQNSILNYFTQMVAIRKSNPVLTYGKYTPQETAHEKLFVFNRELGKENVLIMLNFSDHTVKFQKIGFGIKDRLIGNYVDIDTEQMRPWEALVFKV